MLLSMGGHLTLEFSDLLFMNCVASLQLLHMLEGLVTLEEEASLVSLAGTLLVDLTGQLGTTLVGTSQNVT
jgi:hypothetical protein